MVGVGKTFKSFLVKNLHRNSDFNNVNREFAIAMHAASLRDKTVLFDEIQC